MGAEQGIGCRVGELIAVSGRKRKHAAACGRKGCADDERKPDGLFGESSCLDTSYY